MQDSSDTKTVKNHLHHGLLDSFNGKRDSSSLNRYVVVGAVLASTNSALLGYDIGVMSGAVLYIRDNLNITTTQVEILIGSLNVCSLIGSLASGKTSDLIGRRYTIILAAITFLVGALVMGLATGFTSLMIGRVIAGIGVGYSLMIGPVYSAELSPAMKRGFLSSLPEVFISFGILLGYVSNYTLANLPDKLNWRLMLGLAALPALVVVVASCVMPESPHWLVMQGRLAEANKVLIKTCDSEEEAKLRLTEMVKSSTHCKDQGHVCRDLLLRPSRPIRRMLVVAIGINFFMQASGNDAVIYYSPEVFMGAGIGDKQQLVGVTIIMGLAKTCFVLLSALYLDHFGRRPMLLTGTIGMTVSLVGLGFGSKFLEMSDAKPKWAIGLCVVAVCANVSFFSIGLGPITWVYSSEIFPTRFRAQGAGLAMSINRVVSGIVSMTFLTLSKRITFGGMFFVFGGIMCTATAFFYIILPETKGRNLEEIEGLFEDQITTENHKLLS